MKILAFSDTHTDEWAMKEIIQQSNNADIVICCGDITKLEHGLAPIMKKLSTINKEILIIPGNNETPRNLQEQCQLNNLTYIHNTSVKRGNYNIAGLGGGVTQSAIYNLTEEEMEKRLNKFKRLKNLILVTHAPPKGPLGNTGTNDIGSESIFEFIQENQPLLNICGHVHETAGQEIKIGKTRVINVGKHGKIIKL